MFKFKDLSLDIGSDAGFVKLAEIMKEPEIRAKFKDLDVLDPEDLKILPDSDFALIYYDKDDNKIRRFPCPDISNTIVSALYLLKSKNTIPAAAGRTAAAILSNKMDQFLDATRNNSSSNDNTLTALENKIDHDAIHSLDNLLEDEFNCWSLKYHDPSNIYREIGDTMESKVEEKIKSDTAAKKEARAKLSDSDFVFVSEKNGVKHRLFPITNKDELLKQAAYFDQNYKQFHIEHRNTFAKKLRDKAAEYKVRLNTQTISKYASNEWCPTAYECLKNRINQLKGVRVIYNEKTAEYEAEMIADDTRSQALVGYMKLAEHIGDMDIDKYAHTLYLLDKASGLDKGYGKTIRDPYASTYKQAAFNTSDLVAPLNNLSTVFMGKTINANDLMNLDIGSLGGMIDQSTFDELMKDPIAVFNSLPIPYKSVIIEAINSK
ncbi:MAG: hypothetical protein J6Y02_04920 [Pseudobutyrivibrio sp.]|nr:hypothetical protein [Pseudobutyrivibrio sp.]